VNSSGPATLAASAAIVHSSEPGASEPLVAFLAVVDIQSEPLVAFLAVVDIQSLGNVPAPALQHVRTLKTWGCCKPRPTQRTHTCAFCGRRPGARGHLARLRVCLRQRPRDRLLRSRRRCWRPRCLRRNRCPPRSRSGTSSAETWARGSEEVAAHQVFDMLILCVVVARVFVFIY
jgi:hypothetical protein